MIGITSLVISSMIPDLVMMVPYNALNQRFESLNAVKVGALEHNFELTICFIFRHILFCIEIESPSACNTLYEYDRAQLNLII